MAMNEVPLTLDEISGSEAGLQATTSDSSPPNRLTGVNDVYNHPNAGDNAYQHNGTSESSASVRIGGISLFGKRALWFSIILLLFLAMTYAFLIAVHAGSKCKVQSIESDPVST